MTFGQMADAMDAVNEQHLASRGLDPSHLGKAAAKRWGKDTLPKADGPVTSVPILVLRCGHELPVESTEGVTVGNYRYCPECQTSQDVALIPPVSDGKYQPQQVSDRDYLIGVALDIWNATSENSPRELCAAIVDGIMDAVS